MTLGELLDIAGLYVEMDSDEDEEKLEMEVVFASQPSWPFEYSISGAEIINDKLYLVEGKQEGYLDEKVKGEIGW